MSRIVNIKKKTKVLNGSSSIITVIPKTLIELSGAEIGDRLDWSYNLETGEIFIKIIDKNEFESAKSTENTSSNIDETSKKQLKTNTKTESISAESNKDKTSKNTEKLNPDLFKDEFILDNKVRISVNRREKPTLRLKDMETKEEITSLSVGYRTETEVRQIIEELKNCKSIPELIETINKHRKK